MLTMSRVAVSSLKTRVRITGRSSFPASSAAQLASNTVIEPESKTTQAALDAAKFDRRNRKWLLLSA